MPKPNEPYISLFPFFHVGGLVYAGLDELKEGATCVVFPKYEPKLFLNCIEKYKVKNNVISSNVSFYRSNFTASSYRSTATNISIFDKIIVGQACRRIFY